jgi:hypothetical protein
MKAGPSPNSRPDRRLDEHDPVWRLLALSPRLEPDAWFTARTLARCRHVECVTERGVVWPVRFVRIWHWVLGGGVSLSLAAMLLMAQTHSEKVDKQKNVQEAFEIMASVDSDSDSSSSPSWQDSSL